MLRLRLLSQHQRHHSVPYNSQHRKLLLVLWHNPCLRQPLHRNRFLSLNPYSRLPHQPLNQLPSHNAWAADLIVLQLVQVACV